VFRLELKIPFIINPIFRNSTNNTYLTLKRAPQKVDNILNVRHFDSRHYDWAGSGTGLGFSPTLAQLLPNFSPTYLINSWSPGPKYKDRPEPSVFRPDPALNLTFVIEAWLQKIILRNVKRTGSIEGLVSGPVGHGFFDKWQLSNK
jgi:hypothetical protein